ncbi:MAG TPA: hypothetical protein V6C57_07630, partial [Coleofasciculaceae cyanobacterium]
PPKSEHKMAIGLKNFVRYHDTLSQMGARDPHELMRCMEVHFIRDCAEMAARASLYRRESRWGLYHYRLDFPEKNDEVWFCHVNLKQDEGGEMVLWKRAIEPYVVAVNLQSEAYDVAVR